MANISKSERRLLDLHDVGAYLGVSFWTARDYVLQGLIPVVQMPALRPKDGAQQTASLRRTLVDVRDLDRFIDQRKRLETGTIDADAPAPRPRRKSSQRFVKR